MRAEIGDTAEDFDPKISMDKIRRNCREELNDTDIAIFLLSKTSSMQVKIGT